MLGSGNLNLFKVQRYGSPQYPVIPFLWYFLFAGRKSLINPTWQKLPRKLLKMGLYGKQSNLHTAYN
jgi:hypothetical protein